MSDKTIVSAAIKWWRSKKPCHWDERRHIGAPTVNLSTDEEKLLAVHVSKKVMMSRKPRKSALPKGHPCKSCKKVGKRGLCFGYKCPELEAWYERSGRK